MFEKLNLKPKPNNLSFLLKNTDAWKELPVEKINRDVNRFYRKMAPTLSGDSMLIILEQAYFENGSSYPAQGIWITNDLQITNHEAFMLIDTLLFQNEIKSIHELDTFICIHFPHTANHVRTDENELPTYTVEQLKKEGKNLTRYVNSDKNYVPEYFECGLLSRCLSMAQRTGKNISAAFFQELGYSLKESQYLSKIMWY